MQRGAQGARCGDHPRRGSRQVTRAQRQRLAQVMTPDDPLMTPDGPQMTPDDPRMTPDEGNGSRRMRREVHK